jgi:hypothetical protein
MIDWCPRSLIEPRGRVTGMGNHREGYKTSNEDMVQYLEQELNTRKGSSTFSRLGFVHPCRSQTDSNFLGRNWLGARAEARYRRASLG